MCIFCDIINGKIPCYKLYEDDKVLAFLDISQVTYGHTLIIPKQHNANFLECQEDTLKHLILIAQKLAKHLVFKTDAKGLNILSNVNEIAGQTVNHFHLHLIPRYTEDDACKIQFNESEKIDFLSAVKQLKVVNNKFLE